MYNIKVFVENEENRFSTILNCPNYKLTNHDNSNWNRIDELTFECANCKCKMSLASLDNVTLDKVK